jgi:hypothetical protein
MPPTVKEVPSPPVAIIEQGLSTLDLISFRNFLASIDVPMPKAASIKVPTLRVCSMQLYESMIIDVDTFKYKDIRVVHSSHFRAIFGSFLASFLAHFRSFGSKQTIMMSKMK